MYLQFFKKFTNKYLTSNINNKYQNLHSNFTYTLQDNILRKKLTIYSKINVNIKTNIFNTYKLLKLKNNIKDIRLIKINKLIKKKKNLLKKIKVIKKQKTTYNILRKFYILQDNIATKKKELNYTKKIKLSKNRTYKNTKKIKKLLKKIFKYVKPIKNKSFILKKKLFKTIKKNIFFNIKKKTKKNIKKKKKNILKIIIKKEANKFKKYIKIYFYKNSKLYRRWDSFFLSYNFFKKNFFFKTKKKKNIQIWNNVIFYKTPKNKHLHCLKFKNRKERFKFLDKLCFKKIKQIKKKYKNIRKFFLIEKNIKIKKIKKAKNYISLFNYIYTIKKLKSILKYLFNKKKKIYLKIIKINQNKKKSKNYFNIIKKIKNILLKKNKNSISKNNTVPVSTNLNNIKKKFLYNIKTVLKKKKNNKNNKNNINIKKYYNRDLKKKKKFKKKDLLFWFFFNNFKLKKYKILHNFKKYIVFFRFFNSLLISTKKKKKKKKKYINCNKFKKFIWTFESKLNIFLIRSGFIKNLNQANYIIKYSGILINNKTILKSTYNIKVNDLIQITYYMNIFFKKISKYKKKGTLLFIQNLFKKTKSPFYLEINKKINSSFLLFKPEPKENHIKNIKKFNFFFYKFFFFFLKKKTI